ncbi:MAG: hypothetical protein D6772_00970, partial [Bacteroidetes bacterium]
MKYYSSLLIVLLSVVALRAQILEPVKWDMHSEALGNDEFQLIFTATMDPGWSIYSQYTSDEGPVPTSFNFDAGAHYERIGQVEEKGKKKEGPSELFGGVIVIKFPSGPVVFTQKVKVKEYGKPITGYLEFMTCDDERCLPPTEVDFSFELSASAVDSKSTGAVEAPSSTKEADTPQRTSRPSEVKTKSTAAATPGPTASSPTTELPPSEGKILATARSIQAKDVAEGLLQPVLWGLQVDQLSEEIYQLTFTAQMEDGWSIYSQLTDDNGPVPTTFYFDGEGYERLGKMEEDGDVKEGPDPLFGGVTVIKYPHGPVTFTQQVKVKDAQEISGAIEFMTCDDTQCLPPTEVPFRINLAPLQVQIGDQPLAATPEAPIMSEAVDNFYGGLDIAAVNAEPAGLCGEEEVVATTRKSLWSILGLGFLGGLVALLTPCVFPMMPLTVSFFTKTATSRRKGITDATMYGVFILLVYLLLSIPFHLMDTIDPDILNSI